MGADNLKFGPAWVYSTLLTKRAAPEYWPVRVTLGDSVRMSAGLATKQPPKRIEAERKRVEAKIFLDI